MQSSVVISKKVTSQDKFDILIWELFQSLQGKKEPGWFQKGQINEIH